jgi:endonuclease III
MDLDCGAKGKKTGLELKVEECTAALERLYGVPEASAVDPVDLLVSTILSQNTTDVNCLRAFGKLKASYPDYEDLLLAPEEEIAKAIRAGGLAGIKAGRIKRALSGIKLRAGKADMEFLKGMPKEKARDYLLSLPGVGPKTAAVVLLFAFGMPFMPVDTHVYRVSKRIGLVPENASFEEAERALEACTPEEKYLSLHLNLIRHGRRICRARNPQHESCALRNICDCYRTSAKLK